MGTTPITKPIGPDAGSASPRNLTTCSRPGALSSPKITGGERCFRADRAAELAICAQILELAARNRKLGLLVLKLRNDGMMWTQVLDEVIAASRAPPKA
jgi:hypothetical protein